VMLPTGEGSLIRGSIRPKFNPGLRYASVKSPMVLGLAEGATLRVTLFPFHLCLVAVVEVKYVRAVDSSLRHVWTIAWALRNYGYLVHSCVLYHGSPTCWFSYSRCHGVARIVSNLCLAQLQ